MFAESYYFTLDSDKYHGSIDCLRAGNVKPTDILVGSEEEAKNRDKEPCSKCTE